MIGNEDSITTNDSSTAYASYYDNLINKKQTMQESIIHMNESIGKKDFFKLFLSQDTYDIFNDIIIKNKE